MKLNFKYRINGGKQLTKEEFQSFVNNKTYSSSNIYTIETFDKKGWLNFGSAKNIFIDLENFYFC